MGIFKSFGGLDHLGEYVSLTAKYSLGNIGFSASICARMPLDYPDESSLEMIANCQETTQITGILSSGMMLDKSFGGNYDAVRDCYVNPDQNALENKNYQMINFRQQNFNRLFMEQCAGKTRCRPSFNYDDFAVSKSAIHLNTLLFAQVECKQTDEMVASKNNWGLAAVCIGILMMLSFAVTVRLTLNQDIINERLLDLELVTVDDYTAQT